MLLINTDRQLVSEKATLFSRGRKSLRNGAIMMNNNSNTYANDSYQRSVCCKVFLFSSLTSFYSWMEQGSVNASEQHE